MDPLTQRAITRFVKAVTSLKKALQLEELPEHAERDSVILRFELTAELMPKVLRRLLIERGADVSLPKDAVRAAHTGEIVTEADASILLAVRDDRKRMVHDYSDKFAEELYKRIKKEYAGVFQSLADQIL